MEALGTADSDFYLGLLDQLKRMTDPEQGADEARLNFPLSVIKGIKPENEIEAMLGAQMAVVHMAIMRAEQSCRLLRKLFLAG